MTTSRTNFNETWLIEMPTRLGNFGNTFDMLEKSIKMWIDEGYKPEELGNNAFKMAGRNIVYYWFEENNDIVVAVELERRQQGYAVNVVGKNPKYKNQRPYATDLYELILSTIPYSLLFSDGQLSDDGIILWKKLMSNPSNIVSVYDYKLPGQSFKTLHTPDELDNYLGSDGHYKYRFVLSKKGHSLAETTSYFNTRRYRELAGMILED